MPKHNIYDFDSLYRQTKRAVGVTGSVVKVRFGPVGPGNLRVITHLTAENQTSPSTKIRLAIARGDWTIYINELQNVATDELAVAKADILLGEGDCLQAEFTGTVDGDTLIVHAIGWSQKI